MTPQGRAVRAKYCPDCQNVYPVDLQYCPKHGSRLEDIERVLAGKFVLRNLLGTGSMGAVYEAVQLPMGRKVAIKLLRAELCSSEEMVSRFEREAQAASSFEHRNAITIYDSGHAEDGQVYIAMEYLQGESLAQVLRREGRLPPGRALDLWLPAVEAMAAAHEKGVIHRDLKPDNIFIARRKSKRGDYDQVKVLDFGIAKIREGMRKNLTHTGLTRVHARIGTPLYMAPEQVEGREADARSDVYALGLLLVEMLSGRLPWGNPGDENLEMLSMQRLVRPPALLSELCPGEPISAELQALVSDVLSMDANRRPADAGELLHRVPPLPEAVLLNSGARNDSSLMVISGKTSGATGAVPPNVFPSSIIPSGMLPASVFPVGNAPSGPFGPPSKVTPSGQKPSFVAALPALDNPFLHDEETDIQPTAMSPGMTAAARTPTEPQKTSTESVPTRQIVNPTVELTPTRTLSPPAGPGPGPATTQPLLSGRATLVPPYESDDPRTATDIHPAPDIPGLDDEGTGTDPGVQLPPDAGETPMDLRSTIPRNGEVVASLPGSAAPTGLLPMWEGTVPVPTPMAPPPGPFSGQRRWVLFACLGTGAAIAVLIPTLFGNLRSRPQQELPMLGANAPTADRVAHPPSGPPATIDSGRGPRDVAQKETVEPVDAPGDARRLRHRAGRKDRPVVPVAVPVETPPPPTPPPHAPGPRVSLPTVLQVQFLVSPGQRQVSISCASRKPLFVSCSTPSLCSAVTSVSPGEECRAQLPERQGQSFTYEGLRRQPVKGSLLQVELDLPPKAAASSATSAVTHPLPPHKHR